MSFGKFAILTMILLSLTFFSCQKKPQKIWLHRANDIEKVQYFQDKYAGLEIDVTYVDSLHTFLIFHGGGHIESNPVTFEKWLEQIENTRKIRLWLDFKNINSRNKVMILNELNRICAKHKLRKGNLIVESNNADCLPLFREAHYRTSYYIPKFNPEETSDFDIQRYTCKIRREISENDITTISGYYYQYEFMRDSFPDENIFLWYHMYDTMIRNQYIELANNDDRVKILLVADEVPADWQKVKDQSRDKK